MDGSWRDWGETMPAYGQRVVPCGECTGTEGARTRAPNIPQNSGTIKQVVQIAQSQFGGDIAVAVRSPTVRRPRRPNAYAKTA